MKRDLFTIALFGLMTASCGAPKDKGDPIVSKGYHCTCKSALHAAVKDEEPKKDIEDEIDSAKKVS